MFTNHTLKAGLILLVFFYTNKTLGQINIHTEDLPRFYTAFDSVLTTKDTVKQLAYIQQLYVDKASAGLKKFMELRGGNTSKWREYIVNNEADLKQKRPWILSVLSQEKTLKEKIAEQLLIESGYFSDLKP